jgi:hypothetical protein
MLEGDILQIDRRVNVLVKEGEVGNIGVEGVGKVDVVVPFVKSRVAQLLGVLGRGGGWEEA